MIRVDYICAEHSICRNKTFEIECDRDNIPEAIVCPYCSGKAIRYWGGMSIRSKTYVGTGGGRDMIQKSNDNVIELLKGEWKPYNEK